MLRPKISTQAQKSPREQLTRPHKRAQLAAKREGNHKKSILGPLADAEFGEPGLGRIPLDLDPQLLRHHRLRPDPKPEQPWIPTLLLRPCRSSWEENARERCTSHQGWAGHGFLRAAEASGSRNQVQYNCFPALFMLLFNYSSIYLIIYVNFLVRSFLIQCSGFKG